MGDVVRSQEGKPFNIRHRCFHFSKQILAFERKCEYRKIHYSLFDQLIRSATSIGANVVESRAGRSKRDFTHFLAIALKSANETKYWLCLIRDTIESERDTAKILIREADEISKIIASIIISSSD